MGGVRRWWAMPAEEFAACGSIASIWSERLRRTSRETCPAAWPAANPAADSSYRSFCLNLPDSVELKVGIQTVGTECGILREWKVGAAAPTTEIGILLSLRDPARIRARSVGTSSKRKPEAVVAQSRIGKHRVRVCAVCPRRFEVAPALLIYRPGDT